MKLQLIGLSFLVIGCFQLLDVDGQKKVSAVRVIHKYVFSVQHNNRRKTDFVFVTRHSYRRMAGVFFPIISTVHLSVL